jgi:hypothetical protein
VRHSATSPNDASIEWVQTLLMGIRAIEALWPPANRRAPFALGDPVQLHALVEEAGFHDIHIPPLVETARFPSPESLVAYRLAATPYRRSAR